MKTAYLLFIIAIIILVGVYWKNTENFRYRHRHRYPHYYSNPYYYYPSLYTYFPFYYPYTYTPCMETVAGDIICE
jgi:hypothetical protein